MGLVIMYGFSGYGTSEYGAQRQSGAGVIGPIIRLAMRVLKSTYGISQSLMLRFRTTILTDPQTNDNTLTL